MTGAWPKVPLEDLVDPQRPITYGVVKPGDERPVDGVRLIRGGDVLNGSINPELRTITPAISQPYRRTVLRGGELVMSLVGNPGAVAVVPQEMAGANLARQVGLIALQPNVDARFVMYSLLGPEGRNALVARTKGSVQQVINLADLRRVQISLPPIQTQRRIASILGAYDALIEVNRRRIAVLEEMARRLFEEWFVHFRFPGHEARASELPGGLPQGWTTQTLGNICAVISRGITPTYDDASATLVIGQKCIRDQRLSLAPARRQRKPVPADKLVCVGDVLVNSTGVGTLGRVAQVEAVPQGTAVDSHVTIVRPGAELDRDYFGLALLRLESMFERMGAGATGQTELAKSRVAEVELLLPADQVQKDFGRHARPLRALAHQLAQQNDRLSASRDLLLPRLISGDLPVAAAQREREAVA